MSKRPRYLRFSVGEQILLTKRLSLLLASGMPLLRAVGMMRDEAKSTSSIFVLDTFSEHISRGQPLSSALAVLGKRFGPASVHLVQVGEESGTLAEHLKRVSEGLKREQGLRRKVVGALIYPALIMLATVAITLLLVLYVFPKILPIFKGFHAALPLPTRMLIGASSFLSAYGLLILLFLVLLILSFIFLLRMPRVRTRADRALIRVPIIGSLLREYALASFCRTLSVLLASEAGIVRAVEFTASGCSNLAYRSAARGAAERVARGERVATALALDPVLFPPLLTQMLSVGESTGSLSDSFAYCAGYYEEELDELSRGLTLLIEPVLMICMGLVVGFVAIAIITPIYSITQNLQP